MTDAPRPDLDDAERRVRRNVALSPPDSSIGWLLAEYDRRGAALADAHAENTRLRAELAQADAFGRGEFRVTSWAYDQAVRVMREVKGENARLRTALERVAEFGCDPVHVGCIAQDALAAAPTPTEEDYRAALLANSDQLLAASTVPGSSISFRVRDYLTQMRDALAAAPTPTEPAGVHDAMRAAGIDPATYCPPVTCSNNTAAAPTPTPTECGAWGGCSLPSGHNKGQADIPANHAPTEDEAVDRRARALFRAAHPDGDWWGLRRDVQQEWRCKAAAPAREQTDPVDEDGGRG